MSTTDRSFMGFVHRRRRGAELFLLILSLVVGIGAYAAVGLGRDDQVPTNLLGYGGWMTVLIIACHITIRLTAPYADPVLLPVVAALNGLGLAMMFRLEQSSGLPLLTSQMTWMTLGVLIFIGLLVVVRDHRRLQAFTYTLGLLSVVLLILPLVPGIGARINGARIWIRLFGFSFQPGEVAKVLLVIAFAGYLVQHRDALALAGRRLLFIDLPRGRDLGPILVMWLVSLGVLVFERDLGTSLLFFGLFLTMLYVATERPGWLVVGAVMFFSGASVAATQLNHVKTRVDGWLDPFGNAESSFQLIQGLYGLGFGGLEGRGLGQGDPWRTPLAWSDFILPSFGEELGLTGVMAIILLYALIVERSLRTALICRDGFGKLMATGFGVVLALQVFVVIGGVTRLIPLTGLTTPFLSAGGSSLVANWAIIALLLRVSDQARRPPPEVLAPDEDSDQTQVVMLK